MGVVVWMDMIKLNENQMIFFAGTNGAACRYFSAVWCKQSTRKHKKWEGDAFLIAKPPTSRLVILKDPEGKEIGRGSGLAISKVQELEAGSTISFRSGQLLHLLAFYSQ